MVMFWSSARDPLFMGISLFGPRKNAHAMSEYCRFRIVVRVRVLVDWDPFGGWATMIWFEYLSFLVFCVRIASHDDGCGGFFWS